MDVRNLAGKQVLVTGAASGIGRESALAFGRRGADLVICDIDEAGLEETEKVLLAMGRGVFSRRVDVSKAEEMREFSVAVHERVGALDILMNNAGVAIGGTFLDTDLGDWDWIVGINVKGVIHGCHYFIPAMVERGGPRHVVIVSSAAGYSANSALAAYNATKFAVLGLAEALSDELHPHGIGVTAICPGIIDTPITNSARLLGDLATEEMRDEMVSAYRKRNYKPDRVARNILKAIQRGRVVAPISPEAWAMYYGKRFAPALMRRLGIWMGARARKAADSAAALSPSDAGRELQ